MPPSFVPSRASAPAVAPGALCRRVGYLKADQIVRLARRQGRPMIDVALEWTDLDRPALEALLAPAALR